MSYIYICVKNIIKNIIKNDDLDKDIKNYEFIEEFTDDLENKDNIDNKINVKIFKIYSHNSIREPLYMRIVYEYNSDGILVHRYKMDANKILISFKKKIEYDILIKELENKLTSDLWKNIRFDIRNLFESSDNNILDENIKDKNTNTNTVISVLYFEPLLFSHYSLILNTCKNICHENNLKIDFERNYMYANTLCA